MGNAHNSRPEIQARRLADARNPECARRAAIYRSAKGKFLGHFDKRTLVAQWNIEWNLSGRRQQPDFPQWLENNRARLQEQKAREIAMQERINASHRILMANQGARA